ncbi:MAG: glycosyltransferase [Acidimicrobiales bacterium]
MRRRLGRFAVIGGLATLLDVGAFLALARARLPLAAADLAAIALAAALSYTLNRTFTFQNDPFVRWVHRPDAFAMIGAVAAGVDLMVLGLLVALVDPRAWPALAALKVGAVGAAAVVRLTAYRWLLFRQVRRDQLTPVPRGPAAGAVRLSVVLPAYRAADQIGAAIRRLRSELADLDAAGGLEIVVIDDGSGDDTAEVARANGADQVISLPENRGKGAAVRAGVLAARGAAVAFTDADLAYSPDQLRGLLTKVEEGWDMVVGSRRHTDTTTLVRAGRLREIGGRGINLFTHALLLGQYRDTQCGLKAFRSDVAKVLFAHTRVDRFAFDVELFHLAERWRLSLCEVPVKVENTERSTVRVARDALGLVRDLLRIRRWAKQGRYLLSAEELALARRGAGPVGDPAQAR